MEHSSLKYKRSQSYSMTNYNQNSPVPTGIKGENYTFSDRIKCKIYPGSITAKRKEVTELSEALSHQFWREEDG